MSGRRDRGGKGNGCDGGRATAANGYGGNQGSGFGRRGEGRVETVLRETDSGEQGSGRMGGVKIREGDSFRLYSKGETS